MSEETHRICSRCGVEYPIENFYGRKIGKNGKNTACKNCIRTWESLYRKSNPEVGRKSYNKWSVSHYRHKWAIKTLHRHRKYGCDVLISVPELLSIAENTDFCFICNEPIDWSPGKGKPSPKSPTLDRINNGKIVSKDSVAIVCGLCNRTKSNRTLSEFIDYCKMVCNRFDCK